MLKKKPMLICGFIIALISYGIIIYVTKDPFTFMTSFPLVCLASMFFGILNIHNTKRRWIISGCAVLFLVGKWVIHEYWLRNASFLISGGSLVGLFLYTIAAGGGVNRFHPKQVLV